MTSLRTRIEEILAYDRPLTRTDALPVWQHQVNALLDIIREQRAEAVKAALRRMEESSTGEYLGHQTMRELRNAAEPPKP